MAEQTFPHQIMKLAGASDADRATTAEGLRLIRAFTAIGDANIRAALLEFAERMAGCSSAKSSRNPAPGRNITDD